LENFPQEKFLEKNSIKKFPEKNFLGKNPNKKEVTWRRPQDFFQN